MTTEAICRTTTSPARADTPTPFIHPHSPDARGRALVHAQIARNCIIAATHHRREGRASWSRSCLNLARTARLKAQYEFRNVRRGG